MRGNKVIKWETVVEGKHYSFEFKVMSIDDEIKHGVQGSFLLIVNGEGIGIWNVSGSTGFLGRLDEPFVFDGKEARLVQLGKEIDVAYKGTYLQSGKSYIETPKWVWIFVALFFFMPVARGYPISLTIVAIGFGASFLHRIISKKKTPPYLHDSILVLATARGGMLSIVLGWTGAYLCVRMVRYDLPTYLKVLFCTMTVFFSWLLKFIMYST